MRTRNREVRQENNSIWKMREDRDSWRERDREGGGTRRERKHVSTRQHKRKRVKEWKKCKISKESCRGEKRKTVTEKQNRGRCMGR